MKKGFTIIELVIVISVLIILIGIAIPRMKGMQQAGNIVKAKGELQTLQAAIESYYNNAVTPHLYSPSSTKPSAVYFVSATPQIITSAMYDPFAATSTTEYDELTNGSYYAFASVGTGTDLSTFTISSTGVVTVATGNICVTNGSGC
ncbi:MAG: prepilin-type N-terminal cleavage/methylation domain-containing protein [Candidatus Omnitrophica bacterium]|nr:prepilin-type N-terminal cleavage/methylation domain-containing protein [Candidatus Omnitrophota bacterium]